jgi:hypothetical protein
MCCFPRYLISSDRVAGRDVETERPNMRSDKETEMSEALVPE